MTRGGYILLAEPGPFQGAGIQEVRKRSVLPAGTRASIEVSDLENRLGAGRRLDCLQELLYIGRTYVLERNVQRYEYI
jgi:hypothetical protein